MKNLFDKATAQEIQQRIDKLNPASQRQWGKMNVAQMLAHCSVSMETATGQLVIPRIFIGRVLAPFVKPMMYNDKSYGKNSPTGKEFIITDKRDFEKEKSKLKSLVTQFSEGGAAKCTTQPHSFFGKATSEEWSKGMYKHLDHHLQQFNA
ncbi:MAG: DUF1569 domain-containing protein [Bacteroidia bacterium]